MKILDKIKASKRNKMLACLTVAGAATVAVLIPVGLNAWGPSRTTYTMQKPASKVTFNSITDNPTVGDERNFLRVRDADSKYWSSANTNGWRDEIANVQEGHTYTIRMYVHNNAGSNLGLQSTNTRAFINIPYKDNVWRKQYEINGFLTADNADPNEIWDNIVLKSDKTFHLKVVSSKYYNNIKTEKAGGFDLGNALYGGNGDNKGALLGYEQMDGTIPGCLQYSGYVLLKVQPVFQQTAKPSYDVAKTVDKVTAKAGDTINYTITVKNTGNTELTNIKINDQLPAYYSNASESVDVAATGSIVKNGSLTINRLAAGETATIKISYKLKDEKDFNCGNTTITNEVTSSSDQDKTEDRTDNNQATTTVSRTCQAKTPGYDVSKTVDKATAKPGDTIKYTITAKNTGNVDLTNVKINDKLPAYYSSASEKTTAPSTTTGSIVKSGSITISKLPAGKTATIVITYKVDASDKLACGDTKIVNKVTSSTDQDKTEDDTKNNEATTTVSKTCENPTTPDKPKNPETPSKENNQTTTTTTTTTTPSKSTPSKSTPSTTQSTTTTPVQSTPAQQPVANQPTTIAETGANNTIITMLALGGIAAAVTAVVMNRKKANR